MPAAAPAPCKQGRAAALAAALHAQLHCPGRLLRRPSAVPTGSVPCAAWWLAQKEEEARCGAARQHTAEARGGEATYGGGKRRRGNIRRRQEAARQEERRPAEEQDRRKAPWAMRPPSQFGCVAGTEGRRGPLRSGEATYGGGKRRRGNIRRRQEAARQEERRPAEEQDRRKAPWAMRPPSQFGCVAGTEGRRGPLRSGEATYGGGKRRRGNIRWRQEAARQHTAEARGGEARGAASG
ncbi:uncharacterized protein [Melanerpes formicivorus]|uniref:uncharacterized protein isoform X1 n=1 Tax=Melanerpes formicivorus TaxID=211600 RepID=UPI00358F6688